MTEIPQYLINGSKEARGEEIPVGERREIDESISAYMPVYPSTYTDRVVNYVFDQDNTVYSGTEKGNGDTGKLTETSKSLSDVDDFDVWDGVLFGGSKHMGADELPSPLVKGSDSSSLSSTTVVGDEMVTSPSDEDGPDWELDAREGKEPVNLFDKDEMEVWGSEEDPWTVFKSSGTSILRDESEEAGDDKLPGIGTGLINKDIIVDPKQPWMSDKLQSILDKLSKEEEEERLELIDNRFAEVLGLDIRTVANDDLKKAIECKINNDFGGDAAKFNNWAQSLAWTDRTTKPALTETTQPPIDITTVAPAPAADGPDMYAPLSFEIPNPFDGKKTEKGVKLTDRARRWIGAGAVGLATGGVMGFGTSYNNLAVAISVPVATAASMTALKLKDEFMELGPWAKIGVSLVGATVLGLVGVMSYRRGGLLGFGGGKSGNHAADQALAPTGQPRGGSTAGTIAERLPTTSAPNGSTTSTLNTTTVPASAPRGGNGSALGELGRRIPQPSGTSVGRSGGSSVFDGVRFKSSNKPGLVSRIKEMYPDLAPKKADEVASNILDRQVAEFNSPDTTTNLDRLVSNGSAAANNLMRQEIARQVAEA